MKKLKLTIAGEVMTFNLPENGEYKCEVEKLYVPKVGDCVRVNWGESGCAIFFKIASIKEDGSIKSEHYVYLRKGEYTVNFDYFWFSSETNFTQITPEELKAKYAEAGYDWDYETNEVKELKWMPKEGEGVWFSNLLCDTSSSIFKQDDITLRLMAERGLLFQTRDKCYEFSNHCLSFLKKI